MNKLSTCLYNTFFEFYEIYFGTPRPVKKEKKDSFFFLFLFLFHIYLYL